MADASNINTGSRSSALKGPAQLLHLKDEISGIKSEAAWTETGKNARTLAKYSDFRIVLTALKQGGTLQKHQAKGCVSIQALEGRIRVRLPQDEVELITGNLIALDNAVSHEVEAIEESVFLITMSFAPAS